MTIAEQLELRGVKKGKYEEAMTIATNMLAEGLDINTIKKVTGLSAEELSKINTKH